jgi:CRP-like cAMP-binding protein
MVIQSGWTKVCVDVAGRERILAIRGVGDLIGERAVLRVRSRSASVVALDAVATLLMPAEDFAAFLDDHPRVLAVLERQVYDRLTEERGPVAGDPIDGGPIAGGPIDVGPIDVGELKREHGLATWAGQNCSILFTDVTAFGDHERDDYDRQTVRRRMYEIIRDGFDRSGVSWAACHHEDRGDGTLVVVPPTIPTVSLVDPLLARLAAALGRHNRQSSDAVRIQLRVALNVGPVVSDTEGVSGESIIHTARLLESPVLKDGVVTTGADLGFIVSTFVYDTVVKHSPGYVDAKGFQQISFRKKESEITAWMHLAGPLARCPAGDLVCGRIR